MLQAGVIILLKNNLQIKNQENTIKELKKQRDVVKENYEPALRQVKYFLLLYFKD